MTTKMLDMLLRIKIKSPEEENFDFKEGVMRWSCAKKADYITVNIFIFV